LLSRFRVLFVLAALAAPSLAGEPDALAFVQKNCATCHNSTLASGTPMAPDVNPRSVFEQLFGSADPGLPPQTRARRALYRKSILDRTRESTEKLVSDLGAADRRKMDEYLTAVRDVEKRISESEKDPLVPPIDKPSGIPFQFSDYVKLMFDLQTIAFQADLTRVATMMFGREGSVRAYPEIDVPDPHHPLTHHRGHPDFIERVTKINCFHAGLFAHFLGKLKATPDGDGTLLDHSSILYGSALADGNTHQRRICRCWSPAVPEAAAGAGISSIPDGNRCRTCSWP